MARHASPLRLSLIGLAAAGFVAAGCGGSTSSGEPFPSVELVGAGDATVSTDSWRGEPLVVNFWYSTCTPCAQELIDFAEVDAETDDVRFIGVNPLDDAPTMTAFAAERGVGYELVRDPLAELQIELEITSFPATVFVSSSGEIIDVTSVLDADGLRDEIDELLAADQTPA